MTDTPDPSAMPAALGDERAATSATPDGATADAVDAAAPTVAPAPASGPRRAPLIAGIVGAVLAVLIGVMAVARAGTNDRVDLTLVGQAAPPIVGTTIDGRSFDLSKRRGSWVLVNFFQTTCVPCVQEHPELRSFVGTSGKAELVTIASPPQDQVMNFFLRNGGTWPVIVDPKGAIWFDYGVAKVPETWVIDPDGIVRARIARATTAATLDALLSKLGAGS